MQVTADFKDAERKVKERHPSCTLCLGSRVWEIEMHFFLSLPFSVLGSRNFLQVRSPSYCAKCQLLKHEDTYSCFRGVGE